MPRSVDGLALVLAATTLPMYVILLPPEPRAWRSDPPMPDGTLFLLLPETAHLAADVSRLGGRPSVLDSIGPDDAAFDLMATPGMVWFTSGSTGLAKPVARTASAIRALVRHRRAALASAGPSAGVVSSDSLAHGQGLLEFLSSCRSGGAFAPLDPINLRAAVSVLARPEFAIWFTTPHTVDALARLPGDGPRVLPPFCFVAGVVSDSTRARFTSRYGRTLRQHYGTSEAGVIAIDAVHKTPRPGAVGQAAEDVQIRIGESPASPLPEGTLGRIWVRSPGQMAGYGFLPHVDSSELVDGWCPTRDLGAIDRDGYLTLAGRMDDCLRTRDGRLVNLAVVAGTLRDVNGVRDAVAVPLNLSNGATFGAVVEGDALLDDVRQQISDRLPPWCWPRHLVLVARLPRLANGKADRSACGALLMEHVEA